MGKSSDEVIHRRVVISAPPSAAAQERRPEKDPHEPDDRRVFELRADIRHTREDLAYTVEALQRKLEPDRLKEQVKASLRAKTIGRAQDMFENTRSTGSGLVDRIRENPIPAAMVAVGLGWLFTRPQDHFDSVDRRGRVDDLAGRAQGQVNDLADRAHGQVNDLAGRAQGQVNDLTNRAQDAASELGGRAREQAHRAQGGFQQMLEESPLALGAIAVAAGAAIGLAAPTTPRRRSTWQLRFVGW